MSTVERITKGFEFLKEDARSVYLIGFTRKADIPEKAAYEPYDGTDDDFDHEYTLLASSGWDEADFRGDIYLPLQDDLYMHFEVYA